ncbi:MAG: Mov34/MPN/PAD-1 family protein [Candidatus Hodarchaeales archaeon]|jgi:proteasome lid subunit RPN8/RPN11
MPEKKDSQSRNLFELLLRDTAMNYNPENSTLTLKFPTPSEAEEEPHTEETLTLKKGISKRKEEIEDLDDLDPEIDPLRVKLQLKAYIRLSLHALKYANSTISKSEWVEVIGLLTGHIENKDTPLACLVITDAFPVGHGTNVNAQIEDPQSMVRVYNESRKKKEMILGWYHSHPSYGAFMSKTDYKTQVRYQRLGTKGSQLSAPIALVIDPTKISRRYYGFKIFRLKKDLKKWEEPRYEVLNCPLESLPELISTLLPLAEGKTMFLEYDYD